MALNFAGLGFVFGAKDQGASRVATRAAKSMEFLNSVVQKLEVTARASKFNAVINSWSSAKIQDISEKISGLNTEMGSMRMTTGIEQEMFDISKQLKPFAAQIGATASQFRRMASAAHKVVSVLNVSPDEAVEGVKAFGRAGDDMAKAWTKGKKPVLDVIRISKLIGKTPSEMREMTKSFLNTMGQLGVSNDDARKGLRKLADEYAYVGQKMGNASAFMKAFPVVVDRINSMTGRLSKELRYNAKQTDTLMRSMIGVVARYRDTGMASDKAAEAAGQFVDKVINIREEVQGLLGGKGAMDIVSTIMPATSGKNATKVMDMLINKPGKLMEVMKEFGNKGIFGFTRMKEVFGEDFVDALGVTDKKWNDTSEKLNKAFGSMGKDAAGAMADLARRSHSSARTFEEIMGRMEDSYEMQMRHLSGLKKSDVLGIHRRRYNRILDTVSTLTAGDGPISKLTKAFFRWKQGGIHTALGAISAELIEVGESALPAITAAGSLGLRFEHIKKYAKLPLAPLTILNKMFLGLPGPIGKVGLAIGAATVGIGLLGKKLQTTAKAGKSWHESMAEEIVNISKKWLNFVPWIEGNLKDMKPWQRVGFIIKTGMDLAWSWVVENFKFGKKTIASIINKLADGINNIDWYKWSRRLVKFVTGAIANVMDGIGDFFRALFSGEIIGGIEKSKSPIGLAISNFFIAVGRAVRDSIHGVWDSFVDWWKDDTKSAADKIKQGGKFLGGAALAGIIAVPGFRNAGFSLIGKFAGGIEAAGGGLFSVINKMFLGLPSLLLKVLGPPALIIGGIGILGYAFEKMGVKSFEGFTEAFGDIFKNKIPNFILDASQKYLPPSISKSINAVADKAESEGKGPWGKLAAVLGAGAKGAFEKGLDISETIINKLSNIDFGKVSKSIGDFFTSVFTGLGSFISGAFSGLFTDLDPSVEATLGQRFGSAIKNGFWIALGFVKSAIVGIVDGIASTFSKIWSDKSTGFGEKLVSSLFTGAAVVGGIGLLLKIFKRKFVGGAKEMSICPRFECPDQRGLLRRVFGKRHDERVPFCPKFECEDKRGLFRRTFGKSFDERIKFCPKFECTKDVKKGFFSRTRRVSEGVSICPQFNSMCAEKGFDKFEKKVKKRRGLFSRFRKGGTQEYGMRELGRSGLWERVKHKIKRGPKLELVDDNSIKKTEGRFKKLINKLRGEPKPKLVDINSVTKDLNKTEGRFSKFYNRVRDKFKRGPKLMDIGEVTGFDKPKAKVGLLDKAKGLGGKIAGSKVGGGLATVGKGIVGLGGMAGGAATAFTLLADSIPIEKVQKYKEEALKAGSATGFLKEKAWGLVESYQKLDTGTQALIQTGSMFATMFAPGILSGLKKIGSYLGPKLLPMLTKAGGALKGLVAGASAKAAGAFGILKGAAAGALSTLKGAAVAASAKVAPMIATLGTSVAGAGAAAIGGAVLAGGAIGGAIGYGLDKAFDISGKVSDKLVEGRKEASKNMSKIGEQQAASAGLIEQAKKYVDMHKSGIKSIVIDGKQVSLTQEFVMKRLEKMSQMTGVSKGSMDSMRGNLIGMLRAGGVESEISFQNIANRVVETTNVVSSGIQSFAEGAKNKLVSIPGEYESKVTTSLDNSIITMQNYKDGAFTEITTGLRQSFSEISSEYPSQLQVDLQSATDKYDQHMQELVAVKGNYDDLFKLPVSTLPDDAGKNVKKISKRNKKIAVDANSTFGKMMGRINTVLEKKDPTAKFRGFQRIAGDIKTLKNVGGKDAAKTMMDIKKAVDNYRTNEISKFKGSKKQLEAHTKAIDRNIKRWKVRVGFEKAARKPRVGGGGGGAGVGLDKDKKDTPRTLKDLEKEKDGILKVISAKQKKLDYYDKEEKAWGGLFGLKKREAEKARKDIPKEMTEQHLKLKKLDDEALSMAKIKMLSGDLSKAKGKDRKVLSILLKDEEKHLKAIRSGEAYKKKAGDEEIKRSKKVADTFVKDFGFTREQADKQSASIAKSLKDISIDKKVFDAEIKEKAFDVEIKGKTFDASNIDVIKELGLDTDNVLDTRKKLKVAPELGAREISRPKAEPVSIDKDGGFTPYKKRAFDKGPEVEQVVSKGDGPPDMREQIAFLSSQIKTLGDRVGKLGNQQFVILGDMGKFMRVVDKKEITLRRERPDIAGG